MELFRGWRGALFQSTLPVRGGTAISYKNCVAAYCTMHNYMREQIIPQAFLPAFLLDSCLVHPNFGREPARRFLYAFSSRGWNISLFMRCAERE